MTSEIIITIIIIIAIMTIITIIIIITIILISIIITIISGRGAKANTLVPITPVIRVWSYFVFL